MPNEPKAGIPILRCCTLNYHKSDVYPMQLYVTLLVKMECVSRMIRAAAQRATLVKYVMSLL